GLYPRRAAGSSAGGAELSHQVLGRHRPRAVSPGGGVSHQDLDPGVRRRGYAVLPSEHGDFAVEVVALDARASVQALPGGAAAAVLAIEGLDLEEVPATGLVLLLSDRVDAGRREDPLGLRDEKLPGGSELAPSGARAAERLHGVAQVAEE